MAGKAGFALYSGSRRKWKLFGNEVQEQGLTCRGGLAWYKDIVVFPCRVQERDEEVMDGVVQDDIIIHFHLETEKKIKRSRWNTILPLSY